ncbi:MAG: AgmX/PglI C-terminal domain-containing protein [Myxococcota bacterium]
MSDARMLRHSAPDRAIELLDEALRDDPTLGEAHELLSSIYFERGQYLFAVEHATQALDLRETSEARRLRGEAELAQENWIEAVEDLRRSLEIDMTQADLHLPIGRALRALGHRKEAIESFERALRSEPGAGIELAELWTEQARDHLSRANHERPDREDLDAARVALGRAVERLPAPVDEPPERSSRIAAAASAIGGLEAELSTRLAELDAPAMQVSALPPSPPRRRPTLPPAAHPPIAPPPAAHPPITLPPPTNPGWAAAGVLGPGTLPVPGALTVPPRSDPPTPAAPIARARLVRTAIRGSLGRSHVERTLRAEMREVQACYAAALRADPSLSGNVTLRLVVGANGNVNTATASSLGTSPVGRCIRHRAERWRFVAPLGDELVVVTAVLQLYA